MITRFALKVTVKEYGRKCKTSDMLMSKCTTENTLCFTCNVRLNKSLCQLSGCDMDKHSRSVMSSPVTNVQLLTYTYDFKIHY